MLPHTSVNLDISCIVAVTFVRMFYFLQLLVRTYLRTYVAKVSENTACDHAWHIGWAILEIIVTIYHGKNYHGITIYHDILFFLSLRPII